MSNVTFHDQLLAFEIARLQNTFGNMLQAERTVQAADFAAKCEELARMADQNDGLHEQLSVTKQIEAELQAELNRRAILIDEMHQKMAKLKEQLRCTDKHAVKPSLVAYVPAKGETL